MTTTTAKRALEKFDTRTRISTIIGREAAQTNVNANDALYARFERSTKLDGRVFKLWHAVAEDFPQHSPAIAAVLVEARALIIAAKAEVDAEKAAKAARIAGRAAKAAHVTKNGVRLGRITKEAFETLAAILEPVRVQYAKRAEEIGRQRATAIIGKVIQAGSFDAAYPKGDYHADGVCLCESKNTGRALASRLFVGNARDIEKYGRWLDGYRRAAEAEVDSYVIKLAGKIGKPVVSGSVNGDLWQGSTLTVAIAGSTESQRWTTKCIINQSCLGKLFNQWPTRRLV